MVFFEKLIGGFSTLFNDQQATFQNKIDYILILMI